MKLQLPYRVVNTAASDQGLNHRVPERNKSRHHGILRSRKEHIGIGDEKLKYCEFYLHICHDCESDTSTFDVMNPRFPVLPRLPLQHTSQTCPNDRCDEQDNDEHCRNCIQGGFLYHLSLHFIL
jgi:hypothetical protein